MARPIMEEVSGTGRASYDSDGTHAIQRPVKRPRQSVHASKSDLAAYGCDVESSKFLGFGNKRLAPLRPPWSKFSGGRTKMLEPDLLLRDLKVAVRSLARTKGLAIPVVLTLALGIGANAAIFSVVRGVLLRP